MHPCIHHGQYVHHLKKKPIHISSHSSFTSLSSLLGTMNLLSVSIGFIIPDISNEWHHIICGLLLLDSFT